jgi:N-acetylglucosamine-6-sulfatase
MISLCAIPSMARQPTVSAAGQHNIFMMLTDDQDSLLGGADWMPNLRSELASQGANFTNAFVHTPICCPSRSSFLSGLYLQNSGVHQNGPSDGCANATWAEGPERHTFAVHLQAAGYRTSYSGKYMNHYGLPGAANCPTPTDPGCYYVPAGWDDWHSLQGNSRYYNGTISDNGVRSVHGDAALDDYLPDLFFNHTFEFLSSHLSAAAASPFLAVLATPSCHQPFTPSPVYAGAFATASAPRTPNYNASQHSIDKKQWLVRQQAAITEDLARGIDHVHNLRLETLLSVDEYIGKVVRLLRRHGALDTTFLLYTSDHGFQLGQHRLPGDKRHLYEHDVRIPFFLRGPGIPASVLVDAPVLSIDVAPTLVHLAAGVPPPSMDGTSLLPLTRRVGGVYADPPTPAWRTDFLVTYYGVGMQPCGLQKCPPPPSASFHENDAVNNTYNCLRTLSPTEDAMFCVFDDDEAFVEYYDHTADSWQLDNCAATAPPQLLAGYRKRMDALRRCAGVSCRAGGDTDWRTR